LLAADQLVSELKSEKEAIAEATSAVNVFLKVILLIADNKDRLVTADEVLSTLNMRVVTGA
jgi:hypothetical protein